MTTEHPTLTRRGFLSVAASSAAVLALPHVPGAWAAASASSAYPFRLGVASGDPRSDSVVLWTRLARSPLDADGGMGQRDVRVEWQLLHYETGRVVRSGAVLAKAAAAHSVHVVVSRLQPGRWYRYRFRALGYVSDRGRTRTLPPPDTMPSSLRFAAVSCQNFQHGYYTAYRHLSEENLHLVLHLGDYIYEGRGSNSSTRQHAGGETLTLADYRIRHAQYKTDPHLQRAHRRFPWMVTFDDHEVDNNWTSESNESGQSRTAFLRRRAAAFRAYYEHMPLRRSSLPDGPDMPIYRRIDFGLLARISVLDTRQYRSAHACGADADDLWSLMCEDALAADRTMVGPDQERWLLAGLNRRARWNVVAQQVLMARWQRAGVNGASFNMDRWDGYPAARGRILSHIAMNRPSNPIVLTGDAHMNVVASLKRNFYDPLDETVATEIVGTSISSGGDGSSGRRELAERQVVDPHIQFLNRRRGYVRHVVTPGRWRADFRIVPYVSRREAPVKTRASWTIRDGVATAVEVDPVA